MLASESVQQTRNVATAASLRRKRIVIVGGVRVAGLVRPFSRGSSMEPSGGRYRPPEGFIVQQPVSAVIERYTSTFRPAPATRSTVPD